MLPLSSSAATRAALLREPLPEAFERGLLGEEAAAEGEDEGEVEEEEAERIRAKCRALRLMSE